MPTKDIKTGVVYELLCNGMQLEVIERINTETELRLLPIFKVVRQGYRSDSYLNASPVGTTFSIIKFTFNTLNDTKRFKRIVNTQKAA